MEEERRFEKEVVTITFKCYIYLRKINTAKG
jgi:hypothetical protein